MKHVSLQEGIRVFTRQCKQKESYPFYFDTLTGHHYHSLVIQLDLDEHGLPHENSG